MSNKIKKWEEFLNENFYGKINNNNVNVGDNVSYEKHDEDIQKKLLKQGIIIKIIPSIKNLSPKFIIKDIDNNLDEIIFGDIVEILNKQ